MKLEQQIKERVQQLQDRLEGQKYEVFHIQCVAWIECLEWVLQ